MNDQQYQDVSSVEEFKKFLCGDKKRKRVKIDSWNKYVWIRELTVGERLQIEESSLYVKEKKVGTLMLEMMKICLETESGEALVPADMTIETIFDHPSGGFFEAGLAVLNANRISTAAVDELKKS